MSALIRPFWWRSGLLAQAALLVGLFVAWDDILSHALGWRTPLDRVWTDHLYPYVSDPYVPSDVRLPSDPSLPSDFRIVADRAAPEIERLLAEGEALVLQQVADALAVVAL